MEGDYGMTYVIIVGENGGYQTHTGNMENIELPDSAEIYTDPDAFEDRLAELDFER